RGIRRAVDSGYGRLWQFVERAQHRADRFCAREILRFAARRHASHPAEIGAGRKGDAAAGEDDNPRFAVRAERLECIGQRMDDAVVDRVAHLRPIDRDGGNAVRVLGNENASLAHLISLRREVLSSGTARPHAIAGERNHSDASSLPNPWIAPATLPRRSELQIIAFIQVTTVVSRSFSKSSILWMLPQPPHGM